MLEVDEAVACDSPAYETLVCIATHADLITAVQAGTSHRSTLAEDLGVSTSTIYKKTRRLMTNGLLERRGSAYHLTNTGQVLADLWADVFTQSRHIWRAREFLSDIPADEIPPSAVFEGATVVSSARHPGRPALVFDRITKDAEQLRGFIPLIHARHLNRARETAPSEHTGEFIFHGRTIEYLLREYPKRVREGIETSALALFETGQELPFGLVIVEEPDPLVCLSAYAHGNETGVLINDSQTALEWGWATYEEYRRDATPLISEGESS